MPTPPAGTLMILTFRFAPPSAVLILFSLPYFPYRDDGQLIWDTLGKLRR